MFIIRNIIYSLYVIILLNIENVKLYNKGDNPLKFSCIQNF